MEKQRVAQRFSIDPAHERLNIYGGQHELTHDIWASKYRWLDEAHPFDSMRRVVEGVYKYDSSSEAKQEALEAMRQALWIPAGRIQAGAGTTNIVTLLNCFVCETIEDSMPDIMDALKDAALTMQQGGGIGMDFSTLRPAGAYLRRTGAIASGPLPFMDMWNAMCATIMSAGTRRGAMMGTMHCEHPDLPAFIKAKRQKGRLTNFNVSVLITDAFMAAVEDDEEWILGFNVPREDNQHLFACEREDGDNEGLWYAYERWSARELWQLIMENTYEYSEPGVIFIDRVNTQNSLNYIEEISCTNPCAEQPLPPNGCCNLGAVNLARMIINPYTPEASFNYDLLSLIVSVGVRFLDNVIDVAIYPLEAQKQEELAKRRIGLGVTGLANALEQLGLRYGSKEAVECVETIMWSISSEAFTSSALLAKERGVFPLYIAEKWGKGNTAVKNLPKEVQDIIANYGMRNGTVLTIAPTGTTSLYAGNVSSGLEPVFLREMNRKVLQADDTHKEYTAYDYGFLLYCEVNGFLPEETLPEPYMVTHADITVEDHLRMQAACQRFIDTSVSKTINCPKNATLEDVKQVYMTAYASGLKGCTTYRPSKLRGSILSAPGEELIGEYVSETQVIAERIRSRDDVLNGRTYKVKWPAVNESYYITINDSADGQPFEMFIQSTSAKYTDWTTALALMISAIMRRGDDISFIPEELSKVISVHDSAWVDKRFYGSLVSMIGHIIGKHISTRYSTTVVTDTPSDDENPQVRIAVTAVAEEPVGEICPECNMPTLSQQEGCTRCLNCDYSSC